MTSAHFIGLSVSSNFEIMYASLRSTSYQYISHEAQHRIPSVVFIMHNIGKIRKHSSMKGQRSHILFVLLQYLQSVVLLASGGWRQIQAISRNLTYLF